jgi:SP family general alpha glucoside:H+ symporter-like MFS transporter
MKKTNEVEENLSASKSYFDCFKGVNLRRTEIACMVWIRSMRILGEATITRER